MSKLISSPNHTLSHVWVRALQKLNLPSALEALERPIGLPPSLLRKAEEVRLEDGPAKIEASIEDVQRLAHHDLAILEEVNNLTYYYL
jgi:programmed cell death 6-interacting protein